MPNKFDPVKAKRKNFPQSTFEWFLFIFPTKLWVLIILGVAGYFIYASWQIVTERNLGIKEKVMNKVETERIKSWERSEDPAWRSALLNTWDKRGEVPKAIWDSYKDENNPEVLIAMAANPWVPGDIKIKLEKHIPPLFNQRRLFLHASQKLPE